MRNIIISILHIDHSPVLNTTPPPSSPILHSYGESRFHILQNILPHIHRDTTALPLRTLPPMPPQLKTSHNTTLLLVNIHHPPPSCLQRSPYGTLTVSRPAMGRLTYAFTDTSISSTIPNQRLLCPSRDHLPLPRSLAQLTRQGMWYISHHLVTLKFAKLSYSPNLLLAAPVIMVVFASFSLRETTVATPQSLAWTPFNSTSNACHSRLCSTTRRPQAL